MRNRLNLLTKGLLLIVFVCVATLTVLAEVFFTADSMVIIGLLILIPVALVYLIIDWEVERRG